MFQAQDDVLPAHDVGREVCLDNRSSRVRPSRIIASWRAGQPYQLRDIDGTPVTIDQARAIIAKRYAIPKDLRARRSRTTDTARTDRRNKKSLSAPSTGPSKPNATTPTAA